MTSNHLKTVPDENIESFWNWFQRVSIELADNFDDPGILAELDRRVLSMGDVSWEIGPGVKEVNALVITPDGSKDQLATTREIISHAPQIPRWEFHFARPPRVWSLEFSIRNELGSIIEYDARNWRYVLFRFSDQTFDIVLEQNNLMDASASDRYAAAVVLLDGLLGELKRLEWIGGIQTVASLPEDQAAKANPIEVLPNHLESLATKP